MCWLITFRTARFEEEAECDAYNSILLTKMDDFYDIKVASSCIPKEVVSSCIQLRPVASSFAQLHLVASQKKLRPVASSCAQLHPVASQKELRLVTSQKVV